MFHHKHDSIRQPLAALKLISSPANLSPMLNVKIQCDTAEHISGRPSSSIQMATSHCSELNNANEPSRNICAGDSNYTTQEIDAMLYIIAEIEPFGVNEWALVATHFAEWVTSNRATMRDSYLLKK